MDFTEELLTGELQGSLLTPERPNGLGVVVLGGSSGRVDVARAGLFASRGAKALALRWFGGAGQSPVIAEIPIERFIGAIDRLVRLGCDRIAFVGTSRGAEAALLVAIEDPRIDVVVAISPSAVVWVGDVWPPRSSWTRGETPLPFVHYDVENMPARGADPLPYRSYFESSMRRFAHEMPAASIAIENARAQVVLVAGDDDALWPSSVFARTLAARLAAAGKHHVLVTHPKAGHRVLLPGETTPRSTLNAHGGDDDADRALGAAAWKQISLLLRLES